MGYIGAHGVAALHKHKYSGVDHSCVAKYVMQPFWSSFVKIFPLWMPFWWALQLAKSFAFYELGPFLMLYPLVILLGGVLAWYFLAGKLCFGRQDWFLRTCVMSRRV